MEVYCVKCKKKQPITKVKTITTSNNRKAKQGLCKVCGTKMMTFI